MMYFAVIDNVPVAKGYNRKQASEKAREAGYTGFTVLSEYDVRRTGTTREQIQELKDQFI